MKERRKYRRYNAEYNIVYSTAEAPGRKFKATSVDISLGGIGVRVKRFIKGKGKLILQIYTPHARNPVKAKATLVWQNGRPGFAAERAGIRFTEIPYTRLKTILA